MKKKMSSEDHMGAGIPSPGFCTTLRTGRLWWNLPPVRRQNGGDAWGVTALSSPFCVKYTKHFSADLAATKDVLYPKLRTSAFLVFLCQELVAY